MLNFLENLKQGKLLIFQVHFHVSKQSRKDHGLTFIITILKTYLSTQNSASIAINYKGINFAPINYELI